MEWNKKGLVFKTAEEYPWSLSHTQVPFVDKIDGDALRIYYGTRDKHNRTVSTFVEVDANDPKTVLYVHDRPVLGLGELGCFDDCGAMPSWIVNLDKVKYFYYTGWNISTTVPYRNSIGLAISDDGGNSFTRLFRGPVMDRTRSEPHFCAMPQVMVEGGIWRMWYLSCVRWVVLDGKAEPYYHIKYAESMNGLDWIRDGTVCIDFKSPEEAGIVRPSIVKDGGTYRMWYSFRGIRGYRTDRNQSYRIGYAESKDGIGWTRLDECAGIDVSEAGWDSEMIAYAHIYEYAGKKHMLYNGNGFGRSGFGYATLVE
jgi:hypothetical protein